MFGIILVGFAIGLSTARRGTSDDCLYRHDALLDRGRPEKFGFAFEGFQRRTCFGRQPLWNLRAFRVGDAWIVMTIGGCWHGRVRVRRMLDSILDRRRGRENVRGYLMRC